MLERLGLVEQTEEGWRLLAAAKPWIPQPVFADLHPGDQVTLEYSTESELESGVVVRVELDGHRVVLQQEDSNSGTYQAHSWEGYRVVNVRGAGRLRLSRGEDGMLSIQDAASGLHLATGLSPLDITSLAVQLGELRRDL